MAALSEEPGSRPPPVGALRGLLVLEFAGLGPAPFCGMMLSDHGADVLRIERPGVSHEAPSDTIYRGRRSVALDLKAESDVKTCLQLIERADALIEGYRPGVMERLGLGPKVAHAHNPRLVYGRVTGWGQTGPLASRAGHDIDYIALSGALHAIGPAERPTPPLNLVGDFGGGALHLAFGLLAGVLHARTTGEGQVVDCSMVEASAMLMTMHYGRLASGEWIDERASNYLDGAAPFYGAYQCADDGWIAVGAIEPQFYEAFLAGLGLAEEAEAGAQWDRDRWPGLRARIATAVRARSRDEWCSRFAGIDACIAPILTLAEAPLHPHNRARGSFTRSGGVLQPSPTPRFSHTPGRIQGLPPRCGEHTTDALADWGVPDFGVTPQSKTES